eukprot:scaffold116990_cov20-Attheya_sp.AAC.1
MLSVFSPQRSADACMTSHRARIRYAPLDRLDSSPNRLCLAVEAIGYSHRRNFEQSPEPHRHQR